MPITLIVLWLLHLVSDDYGKRLESLLYRRIISKYPELERWRFAKYASYTFIACCNPNYGFSSYYDKDVQYLKDPLYADKIRELCASQISAFCDVQAFV